MAEKKRLEARDHFITVIYSPKLTSYQWRQNKIDLLPENCSFLLHIHEAKKILFILLMSLHCLWRQKKCISYL